MTTESTPRITASYLESFMNRTVRLVGRVTQLRGDTATVDAGGNVSVILNRVRVIPSLLSQTYKPRRPIYLNSYTIV